MKTARRGFLSIGGGVLAALALPYSPRAAQLETIEMLGTAKGERVWFAPIGVSVPPGTTLRFVNRDPGNSHTATAYHPSLYGRERRIPAEASPWDSGFLLPEESFGITLDLPGVYDYYCIPHEMAAMVGRVVVGSPGDPGWIGAAPNGGDLEPETFSALPAVEDILASGRILRKAMP